MSLACCRLKCLPSLASPARTPWALPPFFFFFFSREPVCVRTSQGHSLLLASACPLSFLHLAHTFFLTSSLILCPAVLSPKATTVWVPVTPPRLLTFQSPFAIFLVVGRTCTSGFCSQLLTHSRNSICLKKPLPLSLLFYAWSKLHIFQLFIHLFGFAAVATSLFTISSLLNETRCKVNVGKYVIEQIIKISAINTFFFFSPVPLFINISLIIN